ncbi:hypothetical protein Btru_027854 [Bulinus truncatus]|nr:hypothetical protein Btru_027854 [Bulinus truncatus]
MNLCMVYFVCAGLALAGAVTPVSLTAADIAGFLSAHNLARAAVGVSSLVWNKTLSASAGAYGSNCVFAHSDGNYGENLYASYPAVTNHTQLAITAVNKWVAEKAVANTTWACMTSKPTCGHYTQVIWKTTTSLLRHPTTAPGSLL